MFRLAVIAALALVPQALAQAAAYQQCGGKGWGGSTTCTTSYTCTTLNEYYSQCLPGTATTTRSTTSVGTTTVGTTTRPTTVSPTTSKTSTAPTGAATGYQLRAVSSPVFHFYVQKKGDAVVLGPESSSARYAISGGTIKSTSDGLYLNAATGASTSYKPLSWGTTATTTSWQLEGDTLMLNNPRTLSFLACPTSDTNYYTLYLQQGGDKPSSSCANIDLHLPCLC